MIRSPVLPQMRERLWAIVARRLDSIERGLNLVVAGLDCSDGQLGLVDGVARDANGAAVLVLLAVDGDPLLLARTLSAADFVRRVGASLAGAIPEGNFCRGVAGRLLVVGADVGSCALEQVARLPIRGLQVCRLEAFRIAGSERLAVTWLPGSDQTADAPPADAPPAGASEPAFLVPAAQQAEWLAFAGLCARIDPGVRLDGDRYWRRISWNGRQLGEVWIENGALFGAVGDRERSELTNPAAFRMLGDQLLRQYALAAGLQASSSGAESPDGTAAELREIARQADASRLGATAADNYRSLLAAARLSPEELSALSGMASPARGAEQPTAPPGNAAKIVTQKGPWPPPIQQSH